MSNTPSPFSEKNPNLQLAWDATSLGQLMFCPTAYKYSIIDGWRTSGVDVEFGAMFATATEVYKKARLEGKTKDEATYAAVDRVISDSWIEPVTLSSNMADVSDHSHADHGHPWGGTYENLWHCTGTEKYRNGAGNAAKCPWSHKGKWFPGPDPEQCGECGSPTETVRQWVPVDNAKNRHTLIRLVEWYCEEQPDNMEDGLMPYKFPNGQPAVELSFKLPLPWKTKAGEPYILTGHLDSIMTDGSEHFIADNKTTKKTLGMGYWATYSPNIQVDTYDFAGSLLYPELNLKGVMIEGAQVLVEGARFGSHIVPRTEPLREEYYRDLEWWIKQAESFAENNYWPMNRKNCWLCPFKGVCSKEPDKREMYLKADFEKKHWNPLEDR